MSGWFISILVQIKQYFQPTKLLTCNSSIHVTFGCLTVFTQNLLGQRALVGINRTP